MSNRLLRHPALVAIGEAECHALWTAFQDAEDEFIAGLRGRIDAVLARRFGRGFRNALREEFLPTTKWGLLYRELIRSGLAALPQNGLLSCGHEAASHERILKNLAGLLNPFSSRN